MTQLVADKGKVWVKGEFRPVYAVRIDQKIFLLGSEMDDEPEVRVDDHHLYVDWKDRSKSLRLGRCIALSAPAEIKGTLFNGFDNTKHADVLAVNPSGEGVIEKIFKDNAFHEKDLESMGTDDFLQTYLGMQLPSKNP
ncbi:MAG: hypothetical protein COV66_13910 [Nitrospinae bacterium CG11_big_fil_rev_8_21_14_0_20_45_15]|nr:MAG: hypothetical protein COV66_13910 [Nitrospinae bacterium CG11_big_fil_rev_8_21_14_0_20_45_15]